MLSDQSQPFATSLELRLADSFELVQRTKTNSVGEFTFLDIPAVKYEVWALISANNAIPSGCGDILVNSGSFRIGIEFGPDKGLTSENPSVTVALLLISNINSPDLVATGIYAVTDVQIEEEVGTYLDIPLFCE